MDPFTHAVLGAAGGYALFGKKLGRMAATLGALAALAPDVDALVRSSVDPLAYVQYHRHFTHSFAFAPIGALFVAGLGRLVSGKGFPFCLAWCCAMWGWLSHELLDAATSYGTHLLWPFSSERTGWDVIAIVDPFFTVSLLIGLLLALWCQKQKWAFVALGLGALCLSAGVWQHDRILKAQQQLASERGHTVVRGRALPTIGNNVVWRSVYEHAGRIYCDRLRVGWGGEISAKEGTSLERVSLSDLSQMESAAETRLPAFERFAHFSDGWIARSPLDDSLLGDVRYSLSTEAFDPIWAIRYIGADHQPPFEWVNRAKERRLNLRKLWEEWMGRGPGYRPLN